MIGLIPAVLLALPQAGGAATDSFTVQIEVPSQGDTLRGFIRVAAGPGPHLTVVQLQGFPGSETPTLPATMQTAGYNGVGFMFRGNRRSSGFFTVEGTIDDARAMLAYLRTDSIARRFRIDPNRIVVVGASSGSLATLTTLADDQRVACAAVYVPFNWMHGTIAGRTDSVIRAGFHGIVRQMTSATPPVIKEKSPGSFVEHTVANAERYDLAPVAAQLRGRKLMLIGAAQDNVAPIPVHYRPVLDAARAAGAAVRDTIVDDSHNLPAAGTAATAAMVRWLRSECGAPRAFGGE
jgi:hypothetical protein